MKQERLYLFSTGLILCVTFYIYYINLSNEFLYEFDDDWLILNNPSIRNLSFSNIIHLISNDLYDLSYQPLMYISLALDIELFGYNAFYIKVHNLILHILSGTLVYFFIGKITKSNSLSFWTTCFFLLHPIQVENIAWSACRRQVLFEFYFLLSLISYYYYTTSKTIKVKRISIFTFFIFSIISFLAKYTSFIILPTIILLDIYIHQVSIKELIKYLINKRLGLIIICLMMIAFFTYHNIIAMTENSIDMVKDFDYTLFQFFLISIKSFSFYIEKIIIPFNYAPFYPEANEGSASFTLSYYFYFITSLAIILFFIYSYMKNKFLITFLLGTYIANTLIVCTRLFLYSDLTWNNADRYLYGISPFIFCLIIYFIKNIIKSNKLFNLVNSLIICLFIYNTSQQIKYWGNSLTLFNHTLEKFPSSEFYRRLACVELIYGKEKKAYQSLKKSKLCTLQNNINVPSWTHLQISYIYLVNRDSMACKKELEIVYNKEEFSKYQIYRFNKSIEYDKNLSYKEYINNYFKIIMNQE